MVSFKAARANSKLTDFEGLKDYVIKNSVKDVPRVIKDKIKCEDSALDLF